VNAPAEDIAGLVGMELPDVLKAGRNEVGLARADA